MDAFNRYVLIGYGEKEHQPQNPAEAVTFAMLDVLRRHGKQEIVLGSIEHARNALVAEIISDVGRALSQWKR
jgi:hypothetical protein